VTVTVFDELRAVVAGGDGAGVVLRRPGLLAVAQGPDPAVRRLVELCGECAGPAPGRALAKKLAAWLGSGDDLADGLRFGTVAATDRGLAVFLNGTVDLLVPDRGTAIAGADAATWTDRLIEAPDAPLALTLQGATAPADLVESVYDLWDGVVPGVAVVAVATGVVPSRPVLPVPPEAEEHDGVAGDAVRSPEPDAPDDDEAPGPDTGEHVGDGLPPPAPDAPAADGGATEVVTRRPDDAGARHRRPDTGAVGRRGPGAPRGAERPDGPGPGRPRTPERPQVPDRPRIPPPAREGAAQRAEGPPKAEGYLCSRGHLNDPRAHFCVLCGIRMNERTGVLVVDERPPLGLLVFDDGATHTVDSGFLLGREPDGDARVRAGVLRPIVLDDRSGAMSRVHAEIRLENWDVVLTDSGSSNGTYVAEPGAQSWTGLLPSQAFRLVPGTRVRLGQRTFTFQTPSGVR
jgi:FHA domain